MQLTVCILNWRRPENLPQVIASLRAQTIKPRVFVWDNAGGTMHGLDYEHRPGRPWVIDADWRITSTVNRQCIARWEMLAMADTPFVASLDDDLAIAEPTLLAKAVDFLAKQPAATAIGPYGVTLAPDLDYAKRHNVHAPIGRKDLVCDLIKGRHMMLRREDLNANLRFTDPIFARNWLTRRTEDDIVLCGQLAYGFRGRHLVPDFYRREAFIELPAADAISCRPDHTERRTAACRAAFRPLGVGAIPV